MYPVNKTVSSTTSKVKFFVSSFETVGEGVRTISFNDLIKGEHVISDLIDLQNESINYWRQHGYTADHLRESIDTYVSSHNHNLGSNHSIPSHRLKYGIKNGLIDLNSEALILTDEGWRTHSGLLVADKNANFKEIESIAKKYTEIIPTLTHEQLESFDRKGKIVLNGEVVAEKINPSLYDDEWYIHAQSRTLIGNAKRVLHHQDIPFYLTEDVSAITESLYHGALYDEQETDAISLRDPIERSFGASSPAKGVYMAGLNEAVKVYANGMSMERQALKEFVIENLDREYTNENRQGVIFKARLSNNVSIYNADYNAGCSVYTTVVKPSPYALLAIINHSSTDNKDRVKARVISELSCAENPFEVYRCIERLSESLESQYDRRKIIEKVFNAMGYDSIRIAPPTKEQIQKMYEINQDISKNMDSYISNMKGQCSGNPKSILNDFMNYSQFLLRGVSGLIDRNHVIVFDNDDLPFKVQFTEKLVLPKNEYFKTRSLEALESDPIFSKQNGKNFDNWSLKQLSRHIERVKNNPLELDKINYR